MLHLAPLDTKSGDHTQAIQRIERYDCRIAILSGKNVAEARAQSPYGLGCSVTWNGCGASVTQDTKVIYTMAMISVIMRPEHTINAVDPVGEQLGPAIGRCINKQTRTGIAFDHN
jgi:hypothetical protein